MEQHCEYVWENFVKGCCAEKLFIVAHSAGGYCTYCLLKANCTVQSRIVMIAQEFLSKVLCIALTDSFMGSQYTKEEQEFVKKV